jgi:MFS family permease
MYQLNDESETLSFRQIFRSKLFWVFVLLMVCAGASEHAMVQWSSFFAEESLKISKTVGDLLGPCMFALLMGTSRAVYGAFGDHFPLQKVLVIAGLVCVGSYLLAVFSPLPILSLIGCGFCGLSVGLMWPGVFNLCAKYCTNGGTAMFAFLAVAGDLGCSAGPSAVSSAASAFDGQIRAGLLFGTIFPLILAVGVYMLKNLSKKSTV